MMEVATVGNVLCYLSDCVRAQTESVGISWDYVPFGVSNASQGDHPRVESKQGAHAHPNFLQD